MTRQLKREIWPHCVVLDQKHRDNITAVEVWLGEQLGTFYNRWMIIHRKNNVEFYFHESVDATIFALRWS